MSDYTAALQVKRNIENKYLGFPGIHGLSLGIHPKTKKWTIYFHVLKKIPLDQLPEEQRIPKTIEGIGTKVIDHDQMEPFADEQRYRPLQGGCQIQTNKGKGTLGYFLEQSGKNCKGKGKQLLLTNQHVLNAGEIFQPKKEITDKIGEHFKSILTAKSDAAIGIIEAGVEVKKDLLAIGKVEGTHTVTHEDLEGKKYRVQKYGRTTLLTSGFVTKLNYTGTRKDGWKFEDQIKIEAEKSGNTFAEPGDSGSVVVNDKNQIVALLWGGNVKEGYGTASPIETVLSELSDHDCTFSIPKSPAVIPAVGEDDPTSFSTTSSSGPVSSSSHSHSSSSSSSPVKTPNIQVFNDSIDETVNVGLFVFDTDAPFLWKAKSIPAKGSVSFYTPNSFEIKATARLEQNVTASADRILKPEQELFTISRDENELNINPSNNGNPPDGTLYLVVKRSVKAYVELNLFKDNVPSLNWLGTSPGDTQVIQMSKKFYIALIRPNIKAGVSLADSDLLTKLIEIPADHYCVIKGSQASGHTLEVSSIPPELSPRPVSATTNSFALDLTKPALVPATAGKVILHEYAFNDVDGTAGQSLAYSTVNTCLTVTCICTDGTIAGGHCVLYPFSFWYIISSLANLLKGKEVSHLCVIGADVWLNNNNLQELKKGAPDTIYIAPGKPADNIVQNEKIAITHILSNGGGQVGFQSAAKKILTENGIGGSMIAFNYFSGADLNIEFKGEDQQALLNLGNRIFRYTG